MKVLHCIPTLGIGGAERKLTYLCPQLVERGWQVDVAFMRSGPYCELLRRAGVGLHPYAIRHPYDPQLAWRAFDLVRRLRPDVVQTWMPQMDIVAGASALLLGIPWIVTEESSALMYPPSFRHFVRDQIVRGASAIVACSAGGAAYWSRRVSRVTPKIIPNAVPLEQIDAVAPAFPEAVQPRAGQRLILFVGRLSPEKNPQALVQALRHVSADVLAVFCGVGVEQARLRRSLAACGLTQAAVLAGHVAEVWALMKYAAVLVSPSIVEGQPTAVLEAMACRCPLVVSDIPAHREILDESAAWLVDAADPRALAAAVHEVLAGGADVARRTAEARRRVESLTIDRLGDDYDRFYRAVIAHRG